MDRQHVRPPFAYYGGKTTLAPQIAALLPKHEHYVEPFAGSLAVLLAKEPSRAETVSDLDGDLVTFWRVLRDRPRDLERACILTPHARSEYALAAAAALPEDELERARLVWVRLTQSRSNSMKPTGWQHARTASKVMATHTATLAGHLGPAAMRLRNVTLESRDAIDMIRDYGTEPSVCLYVDPPYLGSTRSATKRYAVEMMGDNAHRTFADALNGCKASVVLSGYDSPLYAELFAGWHRMDIAAPTTLSGDTDRVEVLWSNRPLSEPDLFAFGDTEARAVSYY